MRSRRGRARFDDAQEMMTDDSDDLSKLPSSSGAGDSEFYSDGPAVEGETGDSDDAAAPSNSAEPVVKVKTVRTHNFVTLASFAKCDLLVDSKQHLFIL